MGQALFTAYNWFMETSNSAHQNSHVRRSIAVTHDAELCSAHLASGCAATWHNCFGQLTLPEQDFMDWHWLHIVRCATGWVVKRVMWSESNNVNCCYHFLSGKMMTPFFTKIQHSHDCFWIELKRRLQTTASVVYSLLIFQTGLLVLWLESINIKWWHRFHNIPIDIWKFLRKEGKRSKTTKALSTSCDTFVHLCFSHRFEIKLWKIVSPFFGVKHDATNVYQISTVFCVGQENASKRRRRCSQFIIDLCRYI